MGDLLHINKLYRVLCEIGYTLESEMENNSPKV